MTSESLIRQIEQILTDLKNRDETALDRLAAILGGQAGNSFGKLLSDAQTMSRNRSKLKAWIEEIQAYLALLSQVQAAAHEWTRQGQPDDLRWPAERLAPVHVMRERLQPPLTELEQAFIEPEQECLLREIVDIHTVHEQRCWIGKRLATIGDTRSGIGLDEHGLPHIEWLPVAPGGNIGIKDQTFTVKPFYVARYLITHRQFLAFLDAPDGFADTRWWKDFPQDYVKQEMIDAARQYDNYPRSSVEQDMTAATQQYDNHPCNMVSWYQCVAFTRWLDFKYREFDLWDAFTSLQQEKGTASLRCGLRANGWQIRLPTEWEWQWMAQNGAEARMYPWGDWDRYPRANTREAGIGVCSTAVGMYPHGAAACGALDVAGNLWEWCLNDHDNPQVVDGYGNEKEKVLCGGSFFDFQLCAACASRNHNHPYDRLFGSRGLRVIAASP
ncbi:MAG: SUMF1/EgtB/PvdO family nonheme iron enzyme [Anaerolineae bacterium]|nr:SUMF1/EgtB/PvdO family nonheme iron enzyme [Anaerolineae bacterium]